jgi:hypothetical protein
MVTESNRRQQLFQTCLMKIELKITSSFPFDGTQKLIHILCFNYSRPKKLSVDDILCNYIPAIQKMYSISFFRTYMHGERLLYYFEINR